MIFFRALRVGLVARCILEGGLKHYPNTCCFTQVVRQAEFIVAGAPVRSLFAGPGSGSHCFGLRLVCVDRVCSVMCWFHLCMFVTNYDGSRLPFTIYLVYCSSQIYRWDQFDGLFEYSLRQFRIYRRCRFQTNSCHGTASRKEKGKTIQKYRTVDRRLSANRLRGPLQSKIQQQLGGNENGKGKFDGS